MCDACLGPPSRLSIGRVTLTHLCCVLQRLMSTWQQSSLRARNFDLERYERLTADLARFRRYIRNLQK